MQAGRRIIRTERVEYYLPTPAHYSEVSKAAGAAQGEIDRRDIGTDIWVRSDGEQIIVYFDTEKEVQRA